MGLLPPGSGKALALDTPIPTPDGWKIISQLKIGDKVFGEDGKPCNVTWVSPIWKDRPCYRVTTDCGDTIIADQDHEWSVSLWGSKYKSRVNQTRIRTTKELAQKRGPDHKPVVGPRCKRPMILHSKPLELPEADLMLDPYVLGVWLGDGSSYHPSITVGAQDKDWLSGELTRLGYKHSVLDRTGAFSLSLLEVCPIFKAMNLCGGNSQAGYWKNKHIPSEYFRGSKKQRLALLQGLVDTDGYVGPDGHVNFTNTNLNLVTGAAELARSLGVKATITGPAYPVLDGVKCAPVWDANFYLKDAARMPRKRKLCRDAERTPHTYIDITPCERFDTICIEVDSPNHLFLAGESMTPTHNSIYTSVVFPTHVMGRFKSFNTIVASYGSELPRKFGRRARSITQQAVYKRIFNYTLSEDSKAADEWALTNGSEWMAAGILTGITGNRADGVIWDDLIKGREQADSPVVRQKTWEAYVDDLLTRKKPRAWEIGVTTRWHEDDVAGRILPEDYNGESGLIQCRDGNEWMVICLPAECERDDDILGRKKGEILWPEWFTPQMFAPFKRNPRTWSSLYQQRPSPDSGTLFKAEWLKTYEQNPVNGMPMGMKVGDLNIYGASDYAVTDNRENYTVHIVVGLDNKQNMYLLDLWRDQKSSDVWVEAFIDLCKRWKPVGWAEETGQINAGVGPFLVKRMLERQVYVARRQFPSTKSKAQRAQSIIGRMAMKGLYCPFGAPWFSEFRRELLLFDAGKNDDQVDALSLIGQVLDKMIPAEASSADQGEPKVFSTFPDQCTVTLDDLFEANEKRGTKFGNLRIH